MPKQSPTSSTSSAGSNAAAKQVAQLRNALHLKQTWIPVLLTGGVAFPIFGIIPLLSDPYSAFGSLRSWLPTAGILLGLLMLSVGILYMLQVRALLSRLDQLTPRRADFYDPTSDAAQPQRNTVIKNP